MCILVIGFLCRSAMGPAEYLLNMLGEQALCATVLGAAAVLNIALNFALVPAFGLIGAASATALSLIFSALMNAVVVWHRLDIEMRDLEKPAEVLVHADTVIPGEPSCETRDPALRQCTVCLVPGSSLRSGRDDKKSKQKRLRIDGAFYSCASLTELTSASR